jgi:antitoxin ParD1/3/4
MIVTLTPKQQAWLAAHVARGDFPTIEDALRQLLDERIAERAAEAEEDDLAWAKTLVDEAIAQIERGEFMALEEHEASIEAHLSALGI